MKKGRLMIVALAAAVVFSSGSAFAGETPKVMKKCKACHSWDKGGKNKVGPNLFGVVGRKAGTKEGYKYSGLKGADFVWDEKSLDGWLTYPKKFIGKKTKMSLKLRKEKDRKAAIEFLKTLK